MRVVAAVVVAVAVGVAVPVVHADGRIGALRIDRSTEAQVRAVAGRPASVRRDPAQNTDPGGWTLVYRCGRGCLTQYSFSRVTRKLSDFRTQSRAFATARGSRVGMGAARAAALEGRRIVEGCPGLVIEIAMARERALVLLVDGGRVNEIAYLGSHSVYADGLC